MVGHPRAIVGAIGLATIRRASTGIALPRHWTFGAVPVAIQSMPNTIAHAATPAERAIAVVGSLVVDRRIITGMVTHDGNPGGHQCDFDLIGGEMWVND